MTKLSTIGQIAMVVKDVPRAVAFYRDVLGMKFLFQAPPKLAFFDCGGVRLMLTRACGEGVRPSGLDPLLQGGRHRRGACGSQGKGVDFRDAPHLIAKMPDHELWMAFFRDGEGNTLALMHEKR